MTATFTPIITTIGQSVFIPAATGIEFTFTHVAVGTGTSAVDASATALQNEIARFAIAGGGINTGGKSASINAIITNHTNANPQAYNISEFGFFGTDGNSNTILFAIYRQGTTIINKVAGVDIAIPFSLALGALPVNNITVQLDTNISAMMALLGQHTALNHPHTQYKRTLDNSEKLKIANATASDEAVSLSQMNSAISGGIGGIPPVDLSGKADKNGNANEKFKVANATASDEAVSKGQLDAKAALGGDANQKFKVANATLDDEAVRFKQLTDVFFGLFFFPLFQNIYTSQGTYNITIPANRIIRVLMIGGGGGGGGIANTDYTGANGGQTDGGDTYITSGGVQCITAKGGKYGSSVTTSNGSNGVYGTQGASPEVEVNNAFSGIIINYADGLKAIAYGSGGCPQIRHPIIKALGLTACGQGGYGGSSGHGVAGSGSGGAFVEALFKNYGATDLSVDIVVGAGGSSSSGNYSNGVAGTTGACVVLM